MADEIKVYENRRMLLEIEYQCIRGEETDGIEGGMAATVAFALNREHDRFYRTTRAFRERNVEELL